jgi:hypothetical protein
LAEEALTAVEWEAVLIDHSGETQTLRGVNVLRTTAGALTSALTWGLFALVATGGSVRSLVTWSDREEARSNVARWLGSQP